MIVSGLGVCASNGIGKDAFTETLLKGEHRFGLLKRYGRVLPCSDKEPCPRFIGAEIDFDFSPEQSDEKYFRTASLTAKIAITTIKEAWDDANLSRINPERIGLIIGGSNFQQRELVNTYGRYTKEPHYIKPNYALSFMDTDVCGTCTEIFNVRGPSFTVGGASASGLLAIIQSIQAVQSGSVDACIALGSLMDLSYWECLAFRSAGAMGSDKYSLQPELASRPFDKNRDGFIFGESCGAIVIERANSSSITKNPYAHIKGWGVYMDGNRNPNPSLEGECKAITKALAMANLSARDIDYINPHGSGSNLGDLTELKALEQSGLKHAWINSTKSIIGHGLSSAGTVEVIATILQMKERKLHPSRNLESPIDETFRWVRNQSITHEIKRALKLSMGFGGINTAICIENE